MFCEGVAESNEWGMWNTRNDCMAYIQHVYNMICWGLFSYHTALYWGRIQRKTCCLGPFARADYNLTLCPLQSRLQHIFTLTLCQSRHYPPVRVLGFGLFPLWVRRMHVSVYHICELLIYKSLYVPSHPLYIFSPLETGLYPLFTACSNVCTVPMPPTFYNLSPWIQDSIH